MQFMSASCVRPDLLDGSAQKMPGYNTLRWALIFMPVILPSYKTSYRSSVCPEISTYDVKRNFKPKISQNSFHWMYSFVVKTLFVCLFICLLALSGFQVYPLWVRRGSY